MTNQALCSQKGPLTVSTCQCVNTKT